MRNKYVHLIIFFFILLLVYFFYLFSTLRKSKDIGLPPVTKPIGQDVPSGEVIVKQEESDELAPFKFVNFSLVQLKDFKKYFSDDGNVPMVDLEVEFTDLGSENSFSVTLVGSSNYIVFAEDNGENTTQNNGVVDVHSIDYVIGEKLNLTLGYFPEDTKDARKLYEQYCVISNVFMCNFLNTGFGNDPFDARLLNPDLMPAGTKFTPSQVVVANLSRNLQYPKITN